MVTVLLKFQASSSKFIQVSKINGTGEFINTNLILKVLHTRKSKNRQKCHVLCRRQQLLIVPSQGRRDKAFLWCLSCKDTSSSPKLEQSSSDLSAQTHFNLHAGTAYTVNFEGGSMFKHIAGSYLIRFSDTFLSFFRQPFILSVVCSTNVFCLIKLNVFPPVSCTLKTTYRN